MTKSRKKLIDVNGLDHLRAHTYTVASCSDPSCTHIHIVFYDEERNVLCHTAFERKDIDQMQVTLAKLKPMQFDA